MIIGSKMINNFISKQLFEKIILFFAILFFLEIPITNWLSFSIFSLLCIVILFNKITITKKKYYLIAILLIISLILKINNQSQIEQGFFIYPTNDTSGISKLLPTKVNDFLKNTIDKNYSVEISSLNDWSFSADSIWQNNKLSRKIKRIKFDNIHQDRIGAYNDASMQINHNNWNPYSLRLPLVLKYTLNSNFIDSKLCFRGLVFYNNEFYKYDSKNCLLIKDNMFEFYAFDLDPLPNLSLELKPNSLLHIYANEIKYISYFFAIFLILVVSKISFFSLSIMVLGYVNYFIFLFDLIIKESLPSKLSPFIYMGRGNDGLIHYGHGREIAKFVSEGNIFMALRGGADVFHWMPGLRYFFSMTFFLFGETIFGYLLLGLLFPFIIYNLLKKFFSKKTAKILIFIFLFIPIFESYGFLNFYYMKLIAKGFGGTLGWLCLVAAINLLLIEKNTSKFKYLIYYFLASLLLIVLISTRPNLIPVAFSLIFGFMILSIYIKNYYGFFGLVCGSSTFFLFLLHNYFYGGQFELITNSSSTIKNMPISPDLWIKLLIQVFNFNIDFNLMKKLFIHISIWINFYEIWLMICILSLILMIFSNKFDIKLKIVSISLLFGHSIYILYAGVPRYTYGLWLISFILMLHYFNFNLDNFHKKLFKIIKK